MDSHNNQNNNDDVELQQFYEWSRNHLKIEIDTSENQQLYVMGILIIVVNPILDDIYIQGITKFRDAPDEVLKLFNEAAQEIKISKNFLKLFGAEKLEEQVTQQAIIEAAVQSLSSVHKLQMLNFQENEVNPLYQCLLEYSRSWPNKPDIETIKRHLADEKKEAKSVEVKKVEVREVKVETLEEAKPESKEDDKEEKTQKILQDKIDYINLVKEIVDDNNFWRKQGKGAIDYIANSSFGRFFLSAEEAAAISKAAEGEKTSGTVERIRKVLENWDSNNVKQADVVSIYNLLQSIGNKNVKNDGTNQDTLYTALKNKDVSALRDLNEIIKANLEVKTVSKIGLKKRDSDDAL